MHKIVYVILGASLISLGYSIGHYYGHKTGRLEGETEMCNFRNEILDICLSAERELREEKTENNKES